MRVGFEATLDERVDVSMRWVAKAPALRAATWRNAAASGLLTAVLVFLMETNSQSITRWWVAGFGVVGGALLYLWTFPASHRRRLRRVLLELRGHDRPAHWEFELQERGLCSQGEGTETLMAWQQLQSCTVEAEDVVFQFQQGIAVVRGRAFASSEQRDAFIAQAQELASAAELPSTST